MRAVRIAWFIAESVMLAMYGYPLFCDHASGEPQPKSKEMCHRRIKFNTPMCLASVQEKCNSNNSDMCDYESVYNFNQWTWSLVYVVFIDYSYVTKSESPRRHLGFCSTTYFLVQTLKSGNNISFGLLAASKNKQRLLGCAAYCPLSSSMKLKLL